MTHFSHFRSQKHKGVKMSEINSELYYVNFSLPRYSEIPNVGLFLEQVSKYINEILSPLGEADLTGSMISNYVKKGIIDNPIKKQYGREQIAHLIYIALAKTVLSLEDINTMLSLQRKTYDTEIAYEYFRQEFADILRTVFENKDIAASGADAELKQLSKNISVTIAHKIYLDHIFRGIREHGEA